MHINFTHIKVRQGLSTDTTRIVDIKQQFADVIYQQGQGIACASLAMKIFNSDEGTDYDLREVDLIRQCAQQLVTPAVMDGILAALEEKKTER